MVKGDKTLEPMYADIVKDELNIKEISFIDNTDHFTSYTFKPQLKTLGARFGKQIGEVRTKLAEVDGQKAMNEIRETGAMTLTLSTGDVQIAKDDLLIDEHQKEGYAVFAITEPQGRNEMLYQLDLTTGEVTQTED